MFMTIGTMAGVHNVECVLVLEVSIVGGSTVLCFYGALPYICAHITCISLVCI